ncbi:phage tail tape measure protein [Fusobacterium ulcerans]|uniref:Phage tail tape measure protein, TP901 family, core region n=1 Tax=Fusobacterium ulcerans 12-1B TaxID=457404 RepID=H1PPE3_9FUSO|nr:phage tail tape measure protein [Fusobacterium ulcerans]EHO84467.2 phage tail tape measure protein, TP901 family, core region [Fusobacterium ulcerans 12-1B]
MAPYSNEYILQYIAKLETGDYTKGLDKMQGKTSSSTGVLNKSFSGLSTVIKKVVTSKLSLAAAAIYFANKTRLAIQDMIAFQKQLSTVNTLLKVSREELNKYADAFIDLSIKTGASKEDIANGAYQALSSGVKKEDLVDFLETASKTAMAGQTTAETSIKTISSIMNAYKMEAREAGEIADWLLTVQNKGVTTVGELGAYLADVTAISAPLKVTLNDVGAALAQITQNGNNTAKSTTMLKTMFNELSKEGQQAADIFTKISGQSFRDFIAKGGDLQGALNLMEDYAKKTNKSIVDLFGSVEAGSAALNLTGLNAEKFSEKLNDMKNKSGELNTAYAIASANIKTEWDKLTNAMNSRWRDLVTFLEKPIYVVIKEIRQLVDGQDNRAENLEDTKKRIAALKEEEERILNNKKLNKDQRMVNLGKVRSEISSLTKEVTETENMIREEAYQKNISSYTDYRKELGKYLNNSNKGEEKQVKKHLEKVLKLNKEITSTTNDSSKKAELKKDKVQLEQKIEILDERIGIQEEKIQKETELKKLEKGNLKKHNETMKNSELSYLESKKNMIEEQNRLLDLGAISKEEYNKNIEKADRELLNRQAMTNLESLKEMEEYYKKIGDQAKANEYHKKVIEVEIDIQKRTSVSMGGDFDDREDEYLEEERIKRKQFQAELLQDEWEYLEELTTLKLEGKKSDDEIGTMKEEKMLELEERKIFQEAEELQNRLAFYKTNENYAEQAADTQIAIEENKIKQLELKAKKEELANKQKIKWENWAKKYEVDIYERSANAVMDTYTALATGQIKSLEDFKNFAQMQLAELLLSLGQENAAKAVSKTAEAIGYATNPATASLAPPAFASAAKHAAVAAAFGIAATLVRPDEKTEGTNNKENAITKYDEGIDNRINSAQKENEGDVVIDISDSQMSKLWIKQIEKELNDGYNVTLIGKKKR